MKGRLANKKLASLGGLSSLPIRAHDWHPTSIWVGIWVLYKPGFVEGVFSHGKSTMWGIYRYFFTFSLRPLKQIKVNIYLYSSQSLVDLHHFCWTPNYLSLSSIVVGDTLMFLYNISDWTYKCCCRYTQWLLIIIYFAVGYPINWHELIVIVLKCCWILPPFFWTRYLPIHYHILLLDTQYIYI